MASVGEVEELTIAVRGRHTTRPRLLLNRIDRGSRSQSLVLITELGYLQECIGAIAFQTVNFKTSRPVFYHCVSCGSELVSGNSHPNTGGTWAIQCQAASLVCVL